MSEICLFISEHGDDFNDGRTPEKPLFSVTKALELIRWKEFKSAEFVVSGSITEPASPNAMVSVTGKGLPPIAIRGESRKKPGVFDSCGTERRVLFIDSGNEVRLVDNIKICNGTTNMSGASGITVTDAMLIMENGEISGNNSGSCMGGAVYIGKGGQFIMHGGSIVRNKTTMSGGGVFADEGGVFIMSGGLIAQNQANISGGGVFIGMDSEFIFDGGVIERNCAGGGSEKISFLGVTLEGGNGGGVNVFERGQFTMNGGTIRKNRAVGFTENMLTSSGCGGGVFIESGGNFNFNDGFIMVNSAQTHGRCLAIDGKAAMSGGRIQDDTQNIKKNGTGSSVIVLPEGKFSISGGMVIAAFSLFNPSQLVDSRKEKGRVFAYKIGNEE
jgi:hypothetical protein